MRIPHNDNGGLTLVPMPGFEVQADRVARKIEAFSRTGKKKYTPVDIVHPFFGSHVNDEPFLELGNEHVVGHDCVVLTSGPGTWKMLGELNLALRYLSARRPRRLKLVTAYLPLGRSDKDRGNKVFALNQYIIEQMVSAACTADTNLGRIIAVDLHAEQTVSAGKTGLLTELTLVRKVLRLAIDDALAVGEKVCLAFPDDGSAKRTEPAINAVEADLGMHIPVVCGIKRRTSSTDAELRQLFGDTEALRDATVLCVDDEIATGGTNIKAARIIKEVYKARRVHAVVTHAVLCKGAPSLFLDAACPVECLYVTDTIPIHTRPQLSPLIATGKLRVFEWAEDLGEALYYDHWGFPIRELR